MNQIIRRRQGEMVGWLYFTEDEGRHKAFIMDSEGVTPVKFADSCQITRANFLQPVKVFGSHEYKDNHRCFIVQSYRRNGEAVDPKDRYRSVS